MALFKRIFYRKPQDRLLEITERVYVFDCCFSKDVLEEDEYKMYVCRTVAQIQGQYPDSSFMVFNFKEGERPSQISDILTEFDMTVMDYPRQYEGCPLLPLEMIHYYLRSSESWLSLQGQQNVLLMHCERGGWPILAFMLACLLIYRKQYSDEQKTLEMIYKQAPKALLQLLSPLNPQPSQLRYLQYISRRNLGTNWPPSDTPLFLDCLIIRVLPTFEGGEGCRPDIRVYGQDPKTLTKRGSKLLFSNSKTKTQVRHFRKEECALVKMDIHCHVQGDVVLECIHLNEDWVREEMIFRVVFHTAFVQENILVFYSNEIDTLWDAKYQFPKEFSAEVHFQDPNDVVLPITGDAESGDGNEIENVLKEEYFEVQEIFSNGVDTPEGKVDDESPIVHDNNPEQNNTLREDENCLAIKDQASDDGNRKHDVKVDSSMDMVKDLAVDDVNYSTIDKTNAVKEIVNDNKENKVDLLVSTVDVLRERETTKEMKTLEVMEDKGYREDIISLKNSESKVLQQMLETGVWKRKYEDVLPGLEKRAKMGSESESASSSSSSSVTVKPNTKKIESGDVLATQEKPIVVSHWIPPNKGSYTAPPTLLGSVALKESNLSANLNESNGDVISDDFSFEQESQSAHPTIPSYSQSDVPTTVATFSPGLQQSVSIQPSTLLSPSSSPTPSPYPTPAPTPTPPPPAPPSRSSLLVSQYVRKKATTILPSPRSSLLVSRPVQKRKTSILHPPSPSPSTKPPPPSLLIPRSVQKKTTSILPPPQFSLFVSQSAQKKTTSILPPPSSSPSTSLSPIPTPPPPPPPPPPPISSLLVLRSIQKKTTSILPPPRSSLLVSRFAQKHATSILPPPSSMHSPSPAPPPLQSSLLVSQSVQKNATSILPPPSSTHSSLSTPTPPPPLESSLLVSQSVQKNATSILSPPSSTPSPSTTPTLPPPPLPLESSLLISLSVQKKETHMLPSPSYISSPLPSPSPIPILPPSPPPPPRSSLLVPRSVQKKKKPILSPRQSLFLASQSVQSKETSILPAPSSSSSSSLSPTPTPPPPPPPPPPISSLLVARSVQRKTSILPTPSPFMTVVENVISRMSPAQPSPLPPNREENIQNVEMASQTASTSPHFSNNQTPALVFPLQPPPPPPPPPPWKVGNSSTTCTIHIPPPPPPPPTPLRSSKGAPKLSNFRPPTPSASKLGTFRRRSLPPTSKLGSFRPPPPSTPIQIAMAIAFIHGWQSASPTPPHPQNGTAPPSSSPPPPPPPPPQNGAPPPPPSTRHGTSPSPPPPPSSGAPPPPPPPLHGVPPPPPPLLGAPPPPPPPIRGGPPPPPPVPGAPSPPMGGAPPPPPPPGGRAPGPPPPPPPGAPGPPPPPPPGAPGPPPPPGAPGPPPPPGAPGPPPPPGAPGVGPPPPPRGRGRGLSRSAAIISTPRRSPLKPLHWSKVTKAIQGSLWDELQKQGEPQIGSDFDMSELETLFSAVAPKRASKPKGQSKPAGSKPDVVHLVDLKRAYNIEIMLTKFKMPFSDMMAAVLTLDDSVLDADQVENLSKNCPTKEEMELLKGYTGDKETLGKCEQYFLELMKVPRVEAKLRVFSFKIQFNTQIVEFRKSLSTVNSACEEIRNSEKFKVIMKKILMLGNALNQGTARGAAVGFKLDSLLKLHDTRASNSKMTLIHYLCKVLASKSPELLDFHQEFVNLEAATKIQLKTLAEEMQAIIKGLEKVKQELVASENDGPVSEVFCKTLKEFTSVAEAEGASLQNLYSVVGRNADGLSLYFGEDPAKCPVEQVSMTILKFVKMFQNAHEENLKQEELEKKKALKEAESEKAK